MLPPTTTSSLPPCATRDAVREGIAEIEAAEKLLAEKRRELCNTWNRTLPISRVLNEILTDIFDLVAENASCITALETEATWIKSSSWLGLMLVCRAWREVIVATPMLWRVVDARCPLPWLRLTVHRSSETTLHVLLPSCGSDFDEEVINLLKSQVYRIRSIRCYPYDVRLDFPMDTLSNLLNDSPMPRLVNLNTYTELSLDHWIDGGRSLPRMNLFLSPDRFPRLKSLSLGSSVAPSDPTIYSRLRTLSLSDCTIASTLDDFIACLAVSTGLQELSLSLFLKNLSGVPKTLAEKERRLLAALPSLARLSLEYHDVVHTSNFLAGITLNPRTQLNIGVILEPVDGIADPDLLLYQSLVQPSEGEVQVFPIVSNVVDARLTTEGDHYVQGWTTAISSSERDKRGLPQVQLFANETFSRQTEGSTIDGLYDLRVTLSGAPLTRITVKGNLTGSGYDHWADLFRAFPLLETLVLIGNGEADELFVGLTDASKATEDSPEVAKVACPRLTTIAFVCNGYPNWKGVYGTKRLFREMAACLQQRAEMGARLKTLTLHLVHTSPGGKLADESLNAVERAVDDMEYVDVSSIRSFECRHRDYTEWFRACL